MASEDNDQNSENPQPEKKADGQQERSGEDKKQNKKEEDPNEKRKKRRALIIFAVVIVIAAIGGLIYWLEARHFEDTDDAQVDGNLSPIGSRISGTISKVYVNNNQAIKIGDLLVELDPRDNQVAVDQAAAQLAQAESQLASQQPNVPIAKVQANANIEQSRADVAAGDASLASAIKQRDEAQSKVKSQEAAAAQAENDLHRYEQLIAKQELSKQDYDKYDSTAKQQEATLQAMKESLKAAEANVDQQVAKLKQSQSQLSENINTARPQVESKLASVAQQRANVKSSQAQLEQANLNLSYTKIYAPVSGVVMKRAAQIGAGVSAGQQVLTIAETSDLWITANFKETQLQRIKTGQRVTVHVDALDRDFNGSISTIGGATGSVASTLPPENATGNYVKVVQRIPVRIQLDRDQEGHEQLRPGMSVEPKVRVE